MNRKILAVLLAIATLIGTFALASCGKTDSDKDNAEAIKVGFIFLHDENSTYDLNFIKAADEALETLGFEKSQFIYKTNIPEGQECFEAAEDLVDQGCTIIFADSFGHEDYMIEAAKKYPDVQF